MSRSYRRSPIRGITSARSEKTDKQRLHGAWRCRVRTTLRQVVVIDEDGQDRLLLPENPNEILDEWSMDKDGKLWYERHDNPQQGRLRPARRCNSRGEWWWPAWKFWGK